MDKMIGMHKFITTGHEYVSGGPLGRIPPLPIYPIDLVPEGGVCRVETARKRQRCAHCGSMSWVDETIRCLGCQSQEFEDV